MNYPTSYAGIRGMKIAYSLNQGWAILEPDVRRNTENALKLLERQGTILEEVALAWNSEEIRSALLKALMSTGMGEWLGQIKDNHQLEDLTT